MDTESNSTSHRIALPGRGVTLDLADHGDHGGTPVVLLHGILDSRRSFQTVLPHLPAGVRAIAVSQRGHGDSDRPASGYTTRDFASDVLGLLDGLGLSRAVVVGHSMGSIAARRFALDHPDRCARLVLVGAFGALAARHDLKAYADYIASLRGRLDRAFAERSQWQAVEGGAPVAAEFVTMMIDETLKVPVEVVQAAFAGMFADDASAQLHRLAPAALLVWGELDTTSTRADQEQLLQAMPDSRLVVYDGAGHKPHWHHPERFAQDLEAFVLRDL